MVDFFKTAKMLWENKYRFCLVSAKLLRENRLAKIMGKLTISDSLMLFPVRLARNSSQM